MGVEGWRAEGVENGLVYRMVVSDISDPTESLEYVEAKASRGAITPLSHPRPYVYASCPAPQKYLSRANGGKSSVDRKWGVGDRHSDWHDRCPIRVCLHFLIPLPHPFAQPPLSPSHLSTISILPRVPVPMHTMREKLG